MTENRATTWLKQNIFQILAIVTSAFAIYLGLSERITILEQRAYANDSEHGSISEQLKEFRTEVSGNMKEMRQDIKDVNKKTDEIYKIVVDR